MVDHRVAAAATEAKQGNLKQSRYLLSQSLQENPKDAHAWYLLSQVETDNTRAQECIKKVLEIAPDNQQAKDRLAKLEGEAQKFEEIIPPATADAVAQKELKRKKNLRNALWIPVIVIAVILMSICGWYLGAFLDVLSK